MVSPVRYERLSDSAQDQRQPGQRDRDRILYCSYFRRLAGVTQVVNPLEGYIFHNRLTHTLEVAQIGRRLAEKFVNEQAALAQEAGGVDPDVVEAACLSHDLGHPPFGHIAEHELDELAKKHNNPDGFEGNAQTFRIITHIAAQNALYNGLNLTRATLNAVLKYPWFRSSDHTSKQHSKFGAYLADEEAFDFAREGYEDHTRSIEAEIMDYADDVAYSIHDLDDFYRAGLIPADQLMHSKKEFKWFTDSWVRDGSISKEEIEQAQEGLRNLLDTMFAGEQYTGTRDQRAYLRTSTSSLIKDFVLNVALEKDESTRIVLKINKAKAIELRFLKKLVWTYVISNSKLATQYFGQRQIIRTLFQTYIEAVCTRNEDLIPPRFRYELEYLGLSKSPRSTPSAEETRLVVDIISSFTDSQALAMYKRLIGVTPGSILEILYG